MSIAIATTVLNPAQNLDIWLDYHLLRCAVIILYLDDPARRGLFEPLCKGRSVLLFDGAQDAPTMSRPSRLLVRQSSNLKHAISYLLEPDHGGVEWLLHIDQDEILFENGHTSWATDPRIGHVTFTNDEAVPLRHSTSNAFADCVWFQANGPEAEPFMAYGNGKSAVRLSTGVEPDGAHRFINFQGDAITLPDNAQAAMAGQGPYPVLLHYPYPSFESWKAKFTLYGRFSDYWMDDEQYPNRLDFMTQSRDQALVALQDQERGGAADPWAEAKRFFETRAFVGEELQRRIADGRVRRFAPFGEARAKEPGREQEGLGEADAD
ncbi:uncharacterized protein C8A04DRAFT_24521 [Dichotomopilus funicola]|uniref:Glycosyltransferase family 92 protein n=1 Tax=Dichotomopilus funicola TaxID=1934379 RepID=A0AAN6ZRF2_9PEZI|nr:hypothetical protein C8A04DRAFT_24521 [Dichotomopilus funicola]